MRGRPAHWALLNGLDAPLGARGAHAHVIRGGDAPVPWKKAPWKEGLKEYKRTTEHKHNGSTEQHPQPTT